MSETIDARLNAIINELLSNGITYEQATDAFVGKYISAALLMTRGNVTMAARRLGLHRNTLHNKLRENLALRVRPTARQFRNTKGAR